MILGLHQNINSCYFILFLVSSLAGFIDHLVSNTIQRKFQGTLDLHAKIPYLQQYPSKLCLIKCKYKSMFFLTIYSYLWWQNWNAHFLLVGNNGDLNRIKHFSRVRQNQAISHILDQSGWNTLGISKIKQKNAQSGYRN